MSEFDAFYGVYKTDNVPITPKSKKTTNSFIAKNEYYSYIFNFIFSNKIEI
jgi:hypothetical protein